MTISEKIRLLMRRRHITITSLAVKVGLSRQRLTVKLQEGSFNVYDLKKIAAVLDCTFEGCFIMNDTKEKI